MASLPEADREILLLRNFEGLTNAEAAQILELEPAAASKRYGRALLKLRQLLLASGLGESGT
jgi:RNA polymerase sigma-70 factor (ECF subfamily)